MGLSCLAGLWDTWTDKVTDEVHERYTILTINADAHPLMNRMHKPDANLGPTEQDKRSVIPIEAGDADTSILHRLPDINVCSPCAYRTCAPGAVCGWARVVGAERTDLGAVTQDLSF